MKFNFKSDAYFNRDVTVNKTLTASQLEDSTAITYIKQEAVLYFSNEQGDAIESLNENYFGTLPFELAKKINGDIEANYIITAKDIKNINFKFSLESDDIYSGQNYEVNFNQETNKYQILWHINDEDELPNYHEEDLYAEITLEYAYDKQRSYRDQNILFGENGILRDIQNRLDNLKNNFKSIGFEYKKNDEFSSSIDTLTVDSATVNDIILPQEVYDNKETSLVEILKNIDYKISNIYTFTQSGTIWYKTYSNDDIWQEIGSYTMLGPMIIGTIYSRYIENQDSTKGCMYLQLPDTSFALTDIPSIYTTMETGVVYNYNLIAKQEENNIYFGLSRDGSNFASENLFRNIPSMTFGLYLK